MQALARTADLGALLDAEDAVCDLSSLFATVARALCSFIFHISASNPSLAYCSMGGL
jgi:hypothetical protein